jgi:tRNA (adenine22-N1)-methyltransferase
MLNDQRLLACAGHVSGKGIACDVGTDHAYLAAYLVKSGKCGFVIASDVKDGPLLSAKATIEKYGISDKVMLVKSDGLDNIPPDNVSDVIIAGMGAELICSIIEKAPWLKNGVNLILQPMTRAPFLRRWLCQNGYETDAETAVKDSRFFYAIIKAHYTGISHTPDEVFENIGKMDLSDDVSREYAKKQAERLFKAGKGMLEATGGETNSALETAQKIKKLLEG